MRLREAVKLQKGDLVYLKGRDEAIAIVSSFRVEGKIAYFNLELHNRLLTRPSREYLSRVMHTELL
jgi:hypothetical protein